MSYLNYPDNSSIQTLRLLELCLFVVCGGVWNR
jgi:hypothetical protein